MGAGLNDAVIESVDEIGRLRRRTGRYLNDVGKAMLLVAGIDALRAVADKELLVEAEAGCPLQDGNADLLRRPG